jgi:hypothetical protein
VLGLGLGFELGADDLGEESTPPARCLAAQTVEPAPHGRGDAAAGEQAVHLVRVRVGVRVRVSGQD